jgi:uncharacterized protein
MTNFQPFRQDPPDAPSVRGYLHTPSQPPENGLLLTHGAGANCNAPLLLLLAEAFCANGLTVLRCDLPFRQARPGGPPPRGSAERDQAGLRTAVASMRNLVPGQIFLGGHSYGGRQASMLAAAEPGLVASLLLLSYPLHPPERPTDLRTAHFPHLNTPALFVHGVRDGFATPDELATALELIPARTSVLSVPSAGHELLSRKNRDTLPGEIVQAFCSLSESSSSLSTE